MGRTYRPDCPLQIVRKAKETEHKERKVAFPEGEHHSLSSLMSTRPLNTDGRGVSLYAKQAAPDSSQRSALFI